MAGLLQGGVAVLRPGFPPVLQNRHGVPVAVLGGEPLGVDLAGGEHDVGVVVALVAGQPRRVQGDVRDHATVHEGPLAEVADQLDALRVAQLGGQGHPDLAGELAVLARLGGLDPVPQLGAVMDPLRRVGGGEDFDVLDAAACPVVEVQPRAEIVDVLAGAVGGRPRGAAPGRAGNHRGPQVIDRHERAALR